MIKGLLHKYGANIDTDVIIPAKYANLPTPEDLGKHCLENLDDQFVQNVKPGDILMASTNFGCGSSREQAPWSIKGAGVSCIIAKSFARIFFRNAINIALPLMECPEAVDGSESGDVLKIDLSAGIIENITREKVFKATPYPDFISELINAGGLVSYTKKRICSGD
ncbi:3-isopropylmalate dehydratase small subunit [Desulfobacula toluolica]|uniref:3-isopropylmalate dehydratase small subunit n=1 Tax=Desulfobacula toluolica (strain DSM 7467 / Tol2) TaxID=651182 RepID=K0NMY3_DESTT|nr:3-isopropylmalate dehydratase small subunit [Desulfobacula toluolica]CCK81378.1 LeuD: 3-isopropylmalate dehydratase, small subunit [Desulfobacula toluolica Tol2]